MLKSFNLNLLECKFHMRHIVSACLSVLISTYWNVNASEGALSGVDNRVLISTYWNVNLDRQFVLLKHRHVLISTYWNVNQFFKSF